MPKNTLKAAYSSRVLDSVPSGRYQASEVLSEKETAPVDGVDLIQ